MIYPFNKHLMKQTAISDLLKDQQVNQKLARY